MNILLTGATGYIGEAVGEAATRAGHAVTGLARTADAAARIRAHGWWAAPGDLTETVALERLAGAADAVIHTANTGGANAGEADTQSVRAILRALAGSGRPFVYTSGTWVLGEGHSDEGSRVDPAELVAWRAGLEAEVRASAPDIRSVVLRAGIVYGRDGGIPGMVGRGELPIVGTGEQRWPLVHVEDLAELYIGALDAVAGAVLHGVATTLTMRELALLARARTGTRPEMLPLAAARERWGTFADALARDQVVDSARTRRAVGWRPSRPSPIEELLADLSAAA